MTQEKMMKLLKAYNEFTAFEYEDEPITLDELSNFNGIIPIAHTVDDAGKRSIQISYDLENERYLNYIDDKLIKERKATIEKFTNDLYTNSFDDFVSEMLFECEEMQRDYYERKASKYAEKYGISFYEVDDSIMRCHITDTNFDLPFEGWTGGLYVDLDKVTSIEP